MEIKEIRKKGKAGKYRSDIIKATIEGIEIDNYFERKIYEEGELVETIIERRKLPEKVKPPQIVPPPLAEAKLLLIDHKNPFWKLSPEVKRDITCWVVHTEKGETILYDAVTGKKVGEGIPTPTEKAISLSGYHEPSWPDPWAGYRENAAYWFNHWGFSTWSVFAPSKSDHGAAISNGEYKYRYALAHGDQYRFKTQSSLWITASDISSWMGSRPPMWFAFLGHCAGMAGTGSGTLSYAFRKGQLTNTVTIGYYNAHQNPDGWAQSLNWQKKLFSKVDTGVTWKSAYDYAHACYPECVSMLRFVGDTNMGIRPEGGEETMSLDITSDPIGQDIYIDGTKVGVTPKTVEVTCAAHTIQIGSGGGHSDHADHSDSGGPAHRP